MLWPPDTTARTMPLWHKRRAAGAIYKGRGFRGSGPSWRARLLDFDQLQRFAARALDHHRARISELVGLFEKCHALASQLGDPGVEIGDAERDVVVHVPARARERTVALTHV